MKQEYISYWQNTLQHSQNLNFIDLLKLIITTSSYLEEHAQLGEGLQ